MNYNRISKVIFAAIFLLHQFLAFGQIKIGEFIESSDCPVKLPANLVMGENFKFGYVHVPELHDGFESKTIRLAIAIFPCQNPDTSLEPLVMNTSGPGKSNLDNFIPVIAGELGKYILPSRDVVIIELRGLRYSSSFLRCKEVFEANLDMLDENLNFEESREILRKALASSKVSFGKKNINLSAYNNTETAKDIHMVMDALGYKTFSLVGSSAGTLVAHHVINENPDRIRCAILDAGLPRDSRLLIQYVPSIVNSLKNYFDECRNDSLCKNAFPDLEERFLESIEKLNENPKEITVINDEMNEEIKVLVNGYRLAEHILLNMFYSTQIPLLIGNLVEGDYSSFNDFARGKITPSYFADGLGYTVFSDEAGYFSEKDILIDPKYQTFADGICLSGLGGRYLLEVREQWKLKFDDPGNQGPPKTYNTPVLVLNGKYDPVIPVPFDEILRNSYPNSYIYRFDGVPHSAFDNATQCVLPMMLEFLNNPDTAPNSDCMNSFEQVYKLK